MQSSRAAIARVTTKALFAFCIFLAAAASAFFTNSSSVSAAPSPFLTNYQLYDRGEDIRSLQQLFYTQGIVVSQSGPGSSGNETSIFGLHTYQALKEFQSAHGLPTTGFFGSLTRAIINSGFSTPTSLQNISSIISVAGTTTASTTSPFSKSLPGYAPGQIIFIGGGGSPTTPAKIPDATPPSAPSAPSGLSAIVASSTEIDLSWTASAGAAPIAYYNIVRNSLRIATTSNTAFADTALSASTTYLYAINAVNTLGATSASSTATAATYCGQVDAFFNRLSPQPTNSRKSMYENLVCGLVGDGTWANSTRYIFLLPTPPAPLSATLSAAAIRLPSMERRRLVPTLDA